MEHSNDAYTQEDDVMLWQLHDIRRKLAEEHQSPEQINTIGREVIQQYHLENLTIQSMTPHHGVLQKKAA